MADEERWQFERLGLGYRVAAPEIQTEIRVTRIKRSRAELHGQIMVKTNIAGVKTIDGIMHLAQFNLSSSGTRSTLAKYLESRTPGQVGKMDWLDGLETLCQRVIIAEEVGQPYIAVGTTPIAKVSSKFVIDPLVPANVTALLYGPGGSGKSVIALACALSIQNGRELIPGVPPGIKGNVLYLDWETDGPVINERIQAIAAGANFTSVPITYRRCIRPLAEEAEEISNAVAERDIVFMVIDSAGMAMGTSGEYGDSNESTLRLFDAIRHIGVSTQIVDHVSKQEMRSKGKVHGLLPYGSVYKVNLARSAWEVRNGTSEDDETIRIALIHTKANDSRLKPQIGLEIDWQPGMISFNAAEVTGIEPVGRGDESSGEIIMELLADGASMRPPAIIKLVEGAGVKPNTVYKALKTLTEKGLLVRNADGSYRATGKAVEFDKPVGEPYWNN